jgi:hypothetical protein
MVYEIFETGGLGVSRTKTVHAAADTLADAVALARTMFDVVDLEIDALNPRCADFFTRDCRVMSIEPKA